MNNDMKKIVRCLTSFISLFAVVVVCLATPAKASSNIYNAMDYVSDIEISGDNKTVTFEVDGASPLINFIVNGSILETDSGYGSFNGSGAIDSSALSMNIFPFGGPSNGSNALYDNLLDVSDIAPGSLITISANLAVEYVTPQNTMTFGYSSQMNVKCYDSNFQYLGTFFNSPHGGEFEFGIKSNSVPNNIEISLPTDTCYIWAYVSMWCNNKFNIGTWKIDVYPDPFTFSVDINMINENSETMKRVEQKLEDIGGKLDDTNDKLDNVISGTPEMNESADKVQTEMNGAIGDLNSAGDVIASLDKPDVDIDSIVPHEQLAGASYLAYTGLLSMFWENDTIMTMVTILGGVMLVSYILFAEKG